jgi:hypothetical protein
MFAISKALFILIPPAPIVLIIHSSFLISPFSSESSVVKIFFHRKGKEGFAMGAKGESA